MHRIHTQTHTRMAHKSLRIGFIATLQSKQLSKIRNLRFKVLMRESKIEPKRYNHNTNYSQGITKLRDIATIKCIASWFLLLKIKINYPGSTKIPWKRTAAQRKIKGELLYYLHTKNLFGILL